MRRRVFLYGSGAMLAPPLVAKQPAGNVLGAFSLPATRHKATPFTSGIGSKAGADFSGPKVRRV
jgi:hypothetical protein